jgi:hypothetical protein
LLSATNIDIVIHATMAIGNLARSGTSTPIDISTNAFVLFFSERSRSQTRTA